MDKDQPKDEEEEEEPHPEHTALKSIEQPRKLSPRRRMSTRKNASAVCQDMGRRFTGLGRMGLLGLTQFQANLNINTFDPSIGRDFEADAEPVEFKEDEEELLDDQEPEKAVAMDPIVEPLAPA